MNAAILQKTPGCGADLNPFNVTVTAEALQAPQLRNADRGDPRNSGPEADAEYGCVDWYQYHVDERKTTH